MAIQIDRAETFHRLHVKGEPLVLFNVWDAGTAKVVAEAGARAIATGSNAGLRGPLLALVYAQGWQWLGRVRNRDFVCHVQRSLHATRLRRAQPERSSNKTRLTERHWTPIPLGHFY